MRTREPLWTRCAATQSVGGILPIAGLVTAWAAFRPERLWLAKQTEEQHGIRVHFEDDEQPKPSAESVRVLLFQAVRELLMNVIKHAKASQAIVAVRRLEDQVEIRVEDDGLQSPRRPRRRRTHSFGHASLLFALGRIAKMEGVSEVLQFAVIIERSRPFPLESQLS
jgi:signal transduction histidine kinase